MTPSSAKKSAETEGAASAIARNAAIQYARGKRSTVISNRLMFETLTLRPIGVVHTPFPDRVSAPRQTYAAQDTLGTIVLESGRHFEDALSDLDGWEYLWVVYWFHLNDHWRPKVLPPRSKIRRGVFATRSPHRPCPIGLSVVRLERILGLTIHVRGVDMVDGSPVLDLKPYVAAADSVPDARAGWLTTPDPIAPFDVVWSDLAREQALWLETVHGVLLTTPVERALGLGAEPHAYRRIRRKGGALVLAVKDWRVGFEAEGRRIVVLSIATGYRERQLVEGSKDVGVEETLRVHRAFVTRFGRSVPGAP
jgi:tRNA-Thr(GGU) m(6)t(6)A37 methyltransferase TsaA